MPRKHKTPVSKIRNRESQQRSRARHKDLVDDLKQRLEQYERHGVTASLEMQMAARAVNIKNRRLKALLGILGASSNDIDAFLTSFDRRDPKEPGTCTQGYDDTRRVTISPSPNTNPKKLGSGATIGPLRPAPSTVSKLADIPTSIQTLQDSTEMVTTEMDECSQVRTVTSPLILSDVSDCFCPRVLPPPHASPIKSLETSCDVAAAILIELHYQIDPAQARIALGCTGTTDCSVKNTKIFQLIDGIP